MKRFFRHLLPDSVKLTSRLQSRIIAESNLKVMHGPFKGMSYVRASIGSTLVPKILGTYELELHATIQAIIEKRPGHVFNIGAAEGFYAIGFALALPCSKITAWEVSEQGRNLARTLAELNQVQGSRLELRSLCSLSELKRKLGDVNGNHTVTVVVDVEGGEALLLDPEIIPGLFEVDLLVETHDCFISGVKEMLVSRFANSHLITEVYARDREQKDWRAELDFCNGTIWKGAKLAVMDERRPNGMSWLYLEKK